MGAEFQSAGYGVLGTDGGGGHDSVNATEACAAPWSKWQTFWYLYFTRFFKTFEKKYDAINAFSNQVKPAVLLPTSPEVRGAIRLFPPANVVGHTSLPPCPPGVAHLSSGHPPWPQAPGEAISFSEPGEGLGAGQVG